MYNLAQKQWLRISLITLKVIPGGLIEEEQISRLHRVSKCYVLIACEGLNPTLPRNRVHRVNRIWPQQGPRCRSDHPDAFAPICVR